MIFRVEVEERRTVHFYIDTEDIETARKEAVEVADTIDKYDWDDDNDPDFDVAQVVLSEDPAGVRVRGRQIVMRHEVLQERVGSYGIWIGGTKGHFEHTLDYEPPKPPAPDPDPNQGALLDENGDILPDNSPAKPPREIEETPGL